MNYQLETREDHLLVRYEGENLGSDDVRALESILDEYPKENIILQLLSVRSIRQANSLKKIHDGYKKHDLSFIVIVKESLLEELTDDLTTALTESEAYDILELEEIEREIL